MGNEKFSTPHPSSLQEEDSENKIPTGVLVLSFFCGLLVVFLGIKSILQDYHSIQRLQQLESFQETPGKILSVKIRSDTAGSEKDFYPDILYEYFVSDTSIWGWRLSYEEEPQSANYWKERLLKYSIGQSVPVFYNQGNPKDAVLEKKYGNPLRIWIKMGLGICFVLIGLVLAIIPGMTGIKKLTSS